MDKKVLIMAPSARTIVFNYDNIRILQSLGCEVHAAADFGDDTGRIGRELRSRGVVCHCLPFKRRTLIRNIPALIRYRKLLGSGNFSAVHCQTETGGFLTRLAAGKAGKNIRLIYTPHGFSFYKGASVLRWILFYPLERWMGKRMNEIISINREDYLLSENLGAEKSSYVNGVGVETEYVPVPAERRAEKRRELHVPENAVLLLSAGELYKRKNHLTVVKAVALLKNPELYYVLCGSGQRERALRRAAARLGVGDHVIFAGYRHDMREIYGAADLFAFPSLYEGLPVALMEAMSAGLPVIASGIRGNTDLIENGKGGFLLNPKDARGFAATIARLAGDVTLREKMGTVNKKTVGRFDLKTVHTQMEAIYRHAVGAEEPEPKKS